MNRPRVCLISHIYLEEVYRAKLCHIAAAAELLLVSPDQFHWAYGNRNAAFDGACPYGVQIYPCRFPSPVKTSTRWILDSFDLGFRAFRPDIIQVENEAHSFSLLQALIYRRRYVPRAKLVVFVWANQRLTGLKGIAFESLARLIRPEIDFFIAGNSDAQRLLVESGAPIQQIALFPVVGVDTAQYRPAPAEERLRLRSEFGIAADEFVVGYVGRFIKDKGILDLLQAFKVLKDSPDSSNVRLLCVGAGPLQEEIRVRSPNAIIVSPGGGAKVIPFYQMMDVLVLPSRTMPYWKEQFGRVLVEAMACGVPVVGSDSGAIPEVLGNAGMIFPEGQVDTLVNRLITLHKSWNLRSILARLGMQRVIAEYSAAQIAQKNIDVYTQLIKTQ